ncbi:MAG: preprotein translocase subunit SecY [Sandaracinaceae bacterium]|nr:preprotein translocase subunit SecY [Sandaracinaceae bacterium]
MWRVLTEIIRIPELRRRLLFSLGAIAVYRIGIFVTTPGVNRSAMREIVAQGGGFLGMFNLFSGGALEQLSIFALGIMPYVTASIVLQLMSVVFKPLEELRKEGEAGLRKLNQYTRYGTVILSVIQSIGIAQWLVSLNRNAGVTEVVREPGLWFYFITCISLTTGTAFLMWLGEQISERGIGNGISLIIFAGIVADLPDAVANTSRQLSIGQIQPVSILLIGGIVAAVIALIVFFERGQRRIPIAFARRGVGKKLYGEAQVSHLPLRVNSAGVIPPIFASSVLMFPQTLANLKVPGMQELQNHLVPGTWKFNVAFVVLIVFFCFFYTSILFPPVEVADNLKKQGAFIPKIKQGKETAEYIDYVMTRITVGGALYMCIVALIPSFLQSQFHVPFFFGGTSVMIVVGVALDTIQQIESYLISQQYETLLAPREPKLRERRG